MTAPGIQDPAWLTKTLVNYLAGMTTFAVATKKAFPSTLVIQYVNFPFGNSLGKMTDDLTNQAVGLGGPDVFVNEKSLVDGSYTYYPKAAGKVPIGVAVQYSNYSQTANDGKYAPPGIEALHKFAATNLQANYIFWLKRTNELVSNGFPADRDYYGDLTRYLTTIDWKQNPEGGLNSNCPTKFLRCTTN